MSLNSGIGVPSTSRDSDQPFSVPQLTTRPGSVPPPGSMVREATPGSPTVSVDAAV